MSGLDRSRFDRRTLLQAALATGGAAVLAAASRGEGAGAAMAQAAARTKPAGIGPRCHRARRLPDAREPVVRPLLRDAGRGARLRRPPRRLAGELRAGVAGRPRQDAPPLPPRLEVGHRRVHPGPRPQLARGAHELGQRHQRCLRVDPHQPRSSRARPKASSPWATTSAPISPTTTPSPTPSPSATTTTARCSGPPTPTGSWHSRARSTPPVRRADRCSSPTRRPTPSGACTGTPCPRYSRTPV